MSEIENAEIVLIPDVLDRLRVQLGDDLKDKWTDEELSDTAYFLTISGLVPAGTIGIADLNPLSIGVTTNFIAGSLLAPYLQYGVIDPVRIHKFIVDLRENRITEQEFTASARVE